jgi:hypothetical protein
MTSRLGSDVFAQLVPENMEVKEIANELSGDSWSPHGHRSCRNADAPSNMPAKLITLPTFHPASGSLNDAAPAKRNDRSVTLSPRHHSLIGHPYSCDRELFTLGSTRYAWTPLSSSLRDWKQTSGGIANVVGGGVGAAVGGNDVG